MQLRWLLCRSQGLLAELTAAGSKVRRKWRLCASRHFGKHVPLIVLHAGGNVQQRGASARRSSSNV